MSNSLFKSSDVFVEDVYNGSVPDQMDIDVFLKYIQAIENTYQDEGLEDNQHLKDFVDLIKDSNRSVVTGSCVLNARLGKDVKSNDIDLFIDGDLDSHNICKTFLSSDKAGEILSSTFPSKDIKHVRYNDGLVKNGYSMIKLDCSLTTARFIAEDPRGYLLFNINIIFVERDTEANSTRGRSTNGLHGFYFYNPDKDVVSIRGTGFGGLDGRSIYEKQSLPYKTYPKALALHSVDAAFDFEELKYIWDFETGQVVSVYQASMNLLNKWADVISSTSDEELSSYAKSQILSLVKSVNISLVGMEQKHIELTENPDQLTISDKCLASDILHKIQREASYLAAGCVLEHNFIEKVSSPRSLKLINECYAIQGNLIYRINKYAARGYTIKDPKCILLYIRNYIDTYNTNILQSSPANQVMRESALVGETKAIVALKQSLLSIKHSKEKLDIFDKEYHQKVLEEKYPEARSAKRTKAIVALKPEEETICQL